MIPATTAPVAAPANSPGFHGAQIRFTIGRQRRLSGTIGKDGTIAGMLTNRRGPDAFRFEAVPTKS